MSQSLGCNVIPTILKAEIVEMSDMLVFHSELTQLITRNMSEPYISVKASNIHFRFMAVVQTPNLRFDAME
jgi:hypothetical protein